MKLLENVWLLCKSNGISLDKLGNELGFSSKMLYHWDDVNPKINNVIAVADYFGVSIDELCGRTGTKDILSTEEKELLLLFRQLNKEGRTALKATAFGLAAQGIYKKSDMVEEA